MTANEIAEQLALFIAPDQVTELRARDVGQKGRIFAGWWTGDKLHDMARHALALSRQSAAVYFVPNPISPTTGAKRLNKVLDVHKGFGLTHDADVIERRYLIVDLDPRRFVPDDADGLKPDQDCPTSARELAFAYRVAGRHVIPFLADLRFGRPVVMVSGNGIHLVYRISALPGGSCGPVDPAAAILRVLAERFTCYGLSIDPNTYNPCRMLKVPGTAVRRGDASPSRPHRMARIIEIPDGWLKPAAGSLPDPHVAGSDVVAEPAPKPAGKPAALPKRGRGKPAEPQRLFDAGISTKPSH